MVGAVLYSTGVLSVLCVLLISVLPRLCEGVGPVVSSPLGRVRGAAVVLSGGRGTIDVFKGIPHAQPPTGNLRFEAPRPPQSWHGVRDATHDDTRCLSGGHWITPVPSYEHEDCLYLDVYSPRDAHSLPVMLWIHGGSFVHGSKNGANGTVLASRGVIVVATNYRLGTLGYFSAQDDTIPGNFGLLDQISALKWVQNNIASFGGDPAAVTMFGESAGAMSVSLLLLSPLAQGLFARAIMESGVSGMTSFPKIDTHSRQVAIETGNELNCTMPPGKAFLTCLQSKDVLKVFRAHAHASHRLHVASGPMVERFANSLPDYPHNLLVQGKFAHVTTLRGFNSEESQIQDPGNDGLTIEEFRKIVTSKFHPGGLGNVSKYVEIIEDAYISNKSDPFEIRLAAMHFRSDMTFNLATVTETQAMSQFQTRGMKNYLYKFHYRGSYLKGPAWKGVPHTAEIPFVFGFAGWTSYSKSDGSVAEMMVTMWTNFAKYGDPTPANNTQSPMVNWQPFTYSNPTYLLIEDQPSIVTYDSPKDQTMLALYNLTQSHFPKPATSKPDTVVG